MKTRVRINAADMSTAAKWADLITMLDLNEKGSEYESVILTVETVEIFHS